MQAVDGDEDPGSGIGTTYWAWKHSVDLVIGNGHCGGKWWADRPAALLLGQISDAEAWEAFQLHKIDRLPSDAPHSKVQRTFAGGVEVCVYS